MSPTRYGDSLTPRSGSSLITPGLFCKRSRGTNSSAFRPILPSARRSMRSCTPGVHERIDLRAEGRIGRNALEFVPRDRLQNNPGVMSELPERGVKLSPYLVGDMIPRPAHIQGKLGQGIEAFDVRGQRTVDRLDGGCLRAQGVFSPDVLLSGPERCGAAARASLTIVCASSRMRPR